MNRRPRRIDRFWLDGMPRAMLAFGLFAIALSLPACSSGDGDSDTDSPVSEEDLFVALGVVLDVNGEPREGVTVRANETEEEVVTGADGSFEVSASREDPRLVIGDDDDVSYRVVLSVAAAADEVEISRPFFAESLDDAFRAEVDSGTSNRTIRVDDPELAGLALEIPNGAAVSYGASDEVITLLGIAHDRLPRAFPDGRLARLAVHVGPRSLSLSTATLSLPNVDGLPPGTELDFVRYNGSEWGVLGTATVGADGVAVEGGTIVVGGIYAALPRGNLPSTEVRGRILGPGSEPLPDYRIVTVGSRFTTSDEDGFFSIADVPSWPGDPIRIDVSSPLRFRREFSISESQTSGIATGDADDDQTTDFGNVRVEAQIPAGFAPLVSYSPGDGATGIGEFPQIRVRFDREMDLSTLGIQVVRGISRAQAGVEGTTFLRFVGGGTELEFIPSQPLLQTGTFYTVFVSRDARDLDGNLIEIEDASSRFSVANSGGGSGDDVTLSVHNVAPNEGSAGDVVEVGGENLNTEEIRFGSIEAFPDAFDDQDRSFLQVKVPLEIAGEVSIQVKDIEGNFRGSIPFRALPIVDVFESRRVTEDGDGASGDAGDSGDGGDVGEAIPREFVLIGAHLGDSPSIVWNGVSSGSSIRDLAR
ncbi:MAG: Ig-like domain-containing protein, partial [Planctomycetota bacterium]